MTRLVLVRHAESEWNSQSRLQGHGGSGLSPEGHLQAKLVGEYLLRRYPRMSLAVCSDLERVAQTAAPWLAATAADVRRDPRLREIDVGTWSGLTWDEVAVHDPETLAAWRSGYDVRRGGGETFAQLRARVWTALTDAAQGGAAVAVFTHGGPIRVAVAAALDLPPLGERLLEPVANASVTELDLHDGTPRLVSYNMRDHLGGIATV